MQLPGWRRDVPHTPRREGDCEVILAAVAQDGRSLRGMVEELVGDRDIILTPVAQRGDREIVLVAVSQNEVAPEFRRGRTRTFCSVS